MLMIVLFTIFPVIQYLCVGGASQAPSHGIKSDPRGVSNDIEDVIKDIFHVFRIPVFSGAGT